MQSFSDETLMAFADGELEEPAFSEVAAALETDEALAARIDALARGRDVARDAFGPAEAVPFLLRRRVELAIARAERPRRLLPLAMAASIAVLIALPLGWFVSQQSGQRLGEGVLLDGELATVLASLPSGAEHRLDGGALLRPVATFRSADGTLCREFELDAHEAANVIVSCRDAKQWRVAFSTSLPPAGDGYAPAAALEAVENYLNGIGAGAPMGEVEERAALAAP